MFLSLAPISTGPVLISVIKGEAHPLAFFAKTPKVQFFSKQFYAKLSFFLNYAY
jgi:hypothetical protein